METSPSFLWVQHCKKMLLLQHNRRSSWVTYFKVAMVHRRDVLKNSHYEVVTIDFTIDTKNNDEKDVTQISRGFRESSYWVSDHDKIDKEGCHEHHASSTYFLSIFPAKIVQYSADWWRWWCIIFSFTVYVKKVQFIRYNITTQVLSVLQL